MIEIYTDGACEPNPGAGGWAFIAYEGGKEICCKNGGCVTSTNNIMEMTGVLQALDYAFYSGMGPSEFVILSDSQYVVKGCNQWRHGWARKGWEIGKKNLKNAGIWRAIAFYHDRFPCKIEWVKGHSGIEGNERADRLAESGRMQAMAMSEEFAA